MGYHELIAALQQDGAAQVEAIRQDTEAAAEQIRREADARLEQLAGDYSRKQAEAIAAKTRESLAKAELAGRMIRLEAERELAQRLFELAQKSLGLVAEHYGDSLIVSLANELPPGEWEQVRVNPHEVELVRTLFPLAEIRTDEALSAGMEVTRGGGALQIINTLHKRLERCWPEILPTLIKEVCQEAVKDGTVEQH